MKSVWILGENYLVKKMNHIINKKIEEKLI